MSRVSWPIAALALSSAAALTGCGGPAARSADPPPPRVVVEAVVGGPNALACWGQQQLTVYRPMRQETWRFPVGAAPELVQATPDGLPPAGCGAARTTVGAVPADVGDGRQVVVTAGEVRLMSGDTVLWSRSATGALADAAVVGDSLILVGRLGLFRWRPGAGEPQPLRGPDALAGHPLIGVFREGDHLWVQDADGMSWPVGVDATSARVLGPPQRFVPPDGGLRAPVPGGRAEATAGLDGLRLLDADGVLSHSVPCPPVQALAPLPGGRLLLAAGTELRVLRFAAGRPLAAVETEAQVTLAGETHRLIVLTGVAVAVGDYGLLRIELPVAPGG